MPADAEGRVPSTDAAPGPGAALSPSPAPTPGAVARVPRATYRVQLGPAFTFADLGAQAAYLAALGVSHVYLSPILEAAPGSTHGYDVVDHRRVRAELGGEEGYAALATVLSGHALGQVLDIVPNHMAVGPLNPWWWDVLENGPASRYAGMFDVDWEHPEPTLRSRILLPVLGDHYGRVLEQGDLRLAWEGERFTVHYHDDRFPVAPRSLDELLARAAERAESEELAFLADALGSLPPSSTTDPAILARRHRDKEVLVQRLAALVDADPRVGEAVDAVVADANTDVEVLDRLLERQNYRLAWWRSARRDLGYRRFFDVTGLVGLRVEDEAVLERTHALSFRWLADGVIDGLRIDHPDGLRDPEGYVRRLRWAAPRAWIVAEKILEPGEELRRSWPIAGTTGYDFLNRAQRALLDPDGEAPLTEAYERFTGDATPYDDVAREARRDVLRHVLGSELTRLTSLLLEVLERHRRHRDHTRHDLHDALAEVLVAFPVYRTYVDPTPGEPGRPARVTPEDEASIRHAVEAAAAARPDIPADLFGAIGDLLTLRLTGGDPEREFVVRFQQLSGAVMAKGIEDTAFYRYTRLTALNEVGGDPGRWALGVDELHAAAASALERWPGAMLATATHDTKRGEDVRARLLVLAERAGAWSEAVERWSAASEHLRAGDVPDRGTQWLVFQTLVGAWPVTEERLARYLEKATREAKRHTSWTEPDEAWEAAVQAYARGVLADPRLRDDVGGFANWLLRPGRINGLAQTLLKLTMPGVPDVYQGTELWDLSLVDPDNRRPVDYELRRALLADLEGVDPASIIGCLDDPADPGRPKLLLVARTLALRARRPDAFGEAGAYVPLIPTGEAAAHLVAYARGDRVVALVPRLPARLADRGGWADTVVPLPAGRWRDALGSGTEAEGAIEVGAWLERFPVGLLERAEA